VTSDKKRRKGEQMEDKTKEPADEAYDLIEKSCEKIHTLEMSLFAIAEHMIDGEPDQHIDVSVCFGLAHIIGDAHKTLREANEIVMGLREVMRE
jgi:hypothetical protein